MDTDIFGDWNDLGMISLQMNIWVDIPNVTQSNKSLFRAKFFAANFDKAVGFWVWVRPTWPLNCKELSNKVWIRNEPVFLEFPMPEDLKNKGISRGFQVMMDCYYRVTVTAPAVTLRLEEFLG